MKIRVLLADDHALFRQALRLSLEAQADIEVVGEVDNGRGVLAGFASSAPDVVCMDVNMPGLNGIQATELLLARYPQARVVGLSADGSRALAAEMTRGGALGYVVKMNAGAELPEAIRRAHRNQTFVSPNLDA